MGLLFLFGCTYVFPCREIGGVSIVKGKEDFEECSKHSVETFKDEIEDHGFLFISITEAEKQLFCQFKHTIEAKNIKLEINNESSLFLLDKTSSKNCSIDYEIEERSINEAKRSSSKSVMLNSIPLLVLLKSFFDDNS